MPIAVPTVEEVPEVARPSSTRSAPSAAAADCRGCTMARSFNICPQIDPLVVTRVPGVALDMLFLVIIQALAVILLAKFIHLFLQRYN